MSLTYKEWHILTKFQSGGLILDNGKKAKDKRLTGNLGHKNEEQNKTVSAGKTR